MFHQRVIDAQRERVEKALKLELRAYTPTEVQDFLYRMRGVDWTPGVNVVLPTLPPDVQAFITNELLMSKLDFRYWCVRYAKILDDHGELVPLVPWPSQEKFLTRLGEKELEAFEYGARGGEKAWRMKLHLLLLKARQVGGTAISEAVTGHAVFFNSNTRAVIGSDNPDNSKNLWDVLLRIHSNLPPWMQPVVDGKTKANNLHMVDLDSNVQVGSGNMKNTFGQGMTIDGGHLTELSTWLPDNCTQLEKDLMPAFASSKKHHSILIYESTAEGAMGNYFHDLFQASRRGKTEWETLFLGWHSAPNKWTEDPKGVTIEPDVRALAERLQREEGVELTKGQLAFYQKKRNHYTSLNKEEVLLQEFPSTPDEAFQTGLRSVFPIDVRIKVRNMARKPIAAMRWNIATRDFEAIESPSFLEKAEMNPELYDGVLLIYEKVRPGFVYVIGVDASYGLEQDTGAIDVVRVANRAQGAEQVAEFASKTLDPVELAGPAEWIGHYFEDSANELAAKMAIEAQPGSPGITTQAQLIQRGYPHFYIERIPSAVKGGWRNRMGWYTTEGTRTLLTDTGVNAIINGKLKVNSTNFIREMDSFVYVYTPSGKRKMEHSPGMHDDRIFATFIAFYVGHEGDAAAVAESRLKDHEMSTRAPDEVVQFQSMGKTWQECMDAWIDSIGAE